MLLTLNGLTKPNQCSFTTCCQCTGLAVDLFVWLKTGPSYFTHEGSCQTYHPLNLSGSNPLAVTIGRPVLIRQRPYKQAYVIRKCEGKTNYSIRQSRPYRQYEQISSSNEVDSFRGKSQIKPFAVKRIREGH